MSKLSENQKKIFTKNGTLFSLEFKWRPALRCTPESNYLGRSRCRPYSNNWGGIQSKYLEDISPHPPGFRHPCSRPRIKNTGASVLQKQNKKKFFKNFFQAISKKAKKKSEQIFRKVSVIFQPSFDLSKSIVQSSAKDMAIFEDLRLRGQGQGLDL